MNVVYVQSPYLSQIFYYVDPGEASQVFCTQFALYLLETRIYITLPHILNYLCRLTHFKCATHSLHQIKIATFTKCEPNFPEFNIYS